MWGLFEPIHDVTYFHETARGRLAAAGLRGFWRGYFAGRSAPLGPVGPGPVVASFFSFAPVMVYRALPEVWTMADPASVLAARADGAAMALSEILGPTVAAGDVVEAAELLEQAVATLEPGGRVLGAANQDIPRYSQPLARLWQAATTLREHRGDGHIAALVAADIRPLEVLVLRCAIDIDRAKLQPARGWTDEEWSAAADALIARGYLSPDGRATEPATATLAAVEAATDRAAQAPWTALGADAVARTATLLTPIAQACRVLLPDGNAIGVPK
jgi:hypothetical protein